jgi:hypothetical protein
MTGLDVFFGVISVLSLGFAVLSYVQSEIRKANERANVEMMRERLKNLYQGLISIFHSADAAVQLPKTRENMTVEELQDMARVLRGQVYFLCQAARNSRNSLDDWRFGKPLKSDPLPDELEDQPPSEHVAARRGNEPHGAMPDGPGVRPEGDAGNP